MAITIINYDTEQKVWEGIPLHHYDTKSKAVGGKELTPKHTHNIDVSREQSALCCMTQVT